MPRIAPKVAPKVARADVVGSLLRPQYLLDARNAWREGRLSEAEMQKAADRAVTEAVALQESAGLDAITDGEYRRFNFMATMGVRDSSEAAKLLWKAVGKQNATAALLLSGLYLHGDGVPRSCDQARLLLVAAARRGAPQAAQQLRDLESQGCR